MHIQQAGFYGLGASELLIILAVLVFLFGATKLPEIARGSGRALRIFKAETKGLMDDDEATTKNSSPDQIAGGTHASESSTTQRDTTQRPHGDTV